MASVCVVLERIRRQKIIFQKLWPKQINDKNYDHYIFDLRTVFQCEFKTNHWNAVFWGTKGMITAFE